MWRLPDGITSRNQIVANARVPAQRVMVMPEGSDIHLSCGMTIRPIGSARIWGWPKRSLPPQPGIVADRCCDRAR